MEDGISGCKRDAPLSGEVGEGKEGKGCKGSGVTGSGRLVGGVRVPSLGVKGERAISPWKSKEGRAERIKSSPTKL